MATSTRLDLIASGFRIQFIDDNEKQTQAWSDILYMLADEPYTTLAQALLEEPFFIDDWEKNQKPHLILYNAMQSGELFACFHGHKLAGLVLLTGIVREREAIVESWLMPEFRGSYVAWTLWKKVVAYAFSPLGAQGLGLRKLKAFISAANGPAIIAATRAGFYQTGRSPDDGLFSGRLTDMLQVEYLNPQYFQVRKQADEKQPHRQSTAGTKLRATRALRQSGSLSSAARVSNADTKGAKPKRNNGSGRRRGGNATPVATTAKRSNESRRAKSVRK